MSATYLVTGGMGCLGAWTLYHLHRQGKRAVCFDLSEDRQRLDLLLSRDEQAAITFVRGDLTDTQQVRDVFAQHAITHVIHMAALQVPFCRANPPMGAQVNVTGAVNIFEAARHTGVNHVAMASSVAVYGPPELYAPGLLPADAPVAPRTLYGVYKVANELTAQVYWHDYGISSTVLRPYTVYGLGRDQGLTSEPTKAMQAAARGEDFHINFGGAMQFHFASDVALQFILAAEQVSNGALAFNLGGPIVSVAEVARLIMAARPGVRITHTESGLPFPAGCDGSALYAHAATVYATPLAAGIAATIAAFAERLSSG
ncbi:MAG TPA: epimerase [Chloroflexi bacterium]|nr:epimerase [Chloroflexota bacterium]HHW87151.1 NAD-dependent epimerase/dehydratase family protein [Chloroflexota bacterium]